MSQRLNLDPIEVITTEVHPDGTVSALLKVSERDYERLLAQPKGQYSIAGSTEAHAQAEMGMLADIIDGRTITARLPLAEPVALKPRLRACVENWPDAEDGEYNPACCRFPKSCSVRTYNPEHVTPADLESK